MRTAVSDAVWIPEVKPGYTLAALCREVCAEYEKAHGSFPSLMLLENHGVFFAGETTEEIDALVERVMGTLAARVTSEPDFTELREDAGGFKVSDAVAVAVELRYRFNLCVVFSRSKALLEYDPATKPLTPDHIVYTRAWPLVTGAGSVAEAYEKYVSEHGCTPRIVIVPVWARLRAAKRKGSRYGARAVATRCARLIMHAFSAECARCRTR